LEALVRLLTHRECVPASSGTIASVDAPSSSGSNSKIADTGVAQKGGVNREHKVGWIVRLFNCITQLFREADSGKPLATPGSNQPAIQGQALGQPWEFKDFIEFYRAKESNAHIRNDDTTLVLFVPVRCATDERLAALEILQKQLAVKY